MWGRFVERVIAGLKSLAVLSVVVAILAAIIWLSPVSGFLAAFSFALAALVFHRAPLPPIRRAADKLWLTQNTTIAVFLVAILCALTAIPLWVKQYRAEQAAMVAAEQAEQAAMVAAEQARLQALRQSNPKQYLAELKAANDGRWESEFKTLDPPGYATYLADLKAKQEQQRQADIRQTAAQLASTKPDDLQRQSEIYSELLRLDPTNKDYKAAKDKINSLQEQGRAAEERAEKQRIANDFGSRIGYASTAEANFLKSGMDISVTTMGDRHSTLYMKYVLMSRPTVYNMINDHELLATLRGFGFKTVIFSDGFDSVWQYSITENGFEQPH